MLLLRHCPLVTHSVLQPYTKLPSSNTSTKFLPLRIRVDPPMIETVLIHYLPKFCQQVPREPSISYGHGLLILYISNAGKGVYWLNSSYWPILNPHAIFVHLPPFNPEKQLAKFCLDFQTSKKWAAGNFNGICNEFANHVQFRLGYRLRLAPLGPIFSPIGYQFNRPDRHSI
jgi:hypothetical protein